MKIIKQHFNTYEDEIEFAKELISNQTKETLFLVVGSDEFKADILNVDDEDYSIEPISSFPIEESCKDTDEIVYSFAIVEIGYEKYLDNYNVSEYAYVLSNDEDSNVSSSNQDELPEDIQRLISNLAKEFKENPCEHCIGKALVDFYHFARETGQVEEKLNKIIQLQQELEEYGFDFSEED